jgi:hypothetical protein
MKTITSIFILVSLIVFNLPAGEAQEFNSDLDYAQVKFVSAARSSKGTWSFSVTIRHDDEGWNHYADLWVITDPETGDMIGERVLAHPHVNEQPFIRSLSGVVLPDGQRFLEFSAKCTRHGYEGRRILVDLEMEDGEGYRVKLK